MSRLRNGLAAAFAIALLSVAMLTLAGCGSCKGPPATIAPAAVEETADAGPPDLPDEGDTAMATDGTD